MTRIAADEPRPLMRVVIKEELVALTGDPIRALILNQMIYWQQRVKDYHAMLAEIATHSKDPIAAAERAVTLSTAGWFYKTARELTGEIMFPPSFYKTTSRHLDALVDAGWLERRANPQNPQDRTYQYRVHLPKVHADLQVLGYALEGYTTVTAPLYPSAQSNTDVATLDTLSKGWTPCPRVGQGVQTIPENTTEITTKRSSEIRAEMNGGQSNRANGAALAAGARAPAAPPESPPKVAREKTPPTAGAEAPPKTPNTRSGASGKGKGLRACENGHDNGANGVEHQAMIEAICRATGLSMKVRSIAGQIARCSKELRDAGITPAQVDEFLLFWQEADWRGRKGEKPTISALTTGIAKFINMSATERADAITRAQQGGSYATDRSRRAADSVGSAWAHRPARRPSNFPPPDADPDAILAAITIG